MKFWNEISKTATGAANYTVKKAEEIASAAKLKYKLNLAETRLSCTYEGIGRLYYIAVMEGRDTTEAISDLMADVAELTAEIDGYKRSLAEAKNKMICEVCGEEVEAESFYCNHCGAKLVLTNVAGESTDTPDEE